MRCAWPSDRKGQHKTVDCYRPIKLIEGTADFPKARRIAGAEPLICVLGPACLKIMI